MFSMEPLRALYRIGRFGIPDRLRVLTSGKDRVELLRVGKVADPGSTPNFGGPRLPLLLASGQPFERPDNRRLTPGPIIFDLLAAHRQGGVVGDICGRAEAPYDV